LFSGSQPLGAQGFGAFGPDKINFIQQSPTEWRRGAAIQVVATGPS